MSNRLFVGLEWLPKPTEAFNSRCKAALDLRADVGRELRSLATSALDQTQLMRLAGTIDKLRSSGASLKPLTPFRLALLSNCTIDFIAPALVATAVRHGISLEVIKGGYDQVLQDVLAPDSIINRSAPDAVLLAIDYMGLPLRSAVGNERNGRDAVDTSLNYLHSVREGIRRNSNAVCIFQTLSAPPETLFGNMDGIYSGSLRRMIDDINTGIAKLVQGSTDVVVDVAHLASIIGLGEWHSPREWDTAKVPFSDAFVPFYAAQFRSG